MRPLTAVLVALLVLASGIAIFWVGLKINYEMNLEKQAAAEQKIRDTYREGIIID